MNLHQFEKKPFYQLYFKDEWVNQLLFLSNEFMHVIHVI